MTIENTGLHGVYQDAHAGAYGLKVQAIAECVDSAVELLTAEFKMQGVAFPGDDRCMNLELRVFTVALDAAGLNWRTMSGQGV